MLLWTEFLAFGIRGEPEIGLGVVVADRCDEGGEQFAVVWQEALFLRVVPVSTTLRSSCI
jgi:hypothetical protein